MKYLIFDDEVEVENANKRWIQARKKAGIFDKKKGKKADVEITKAWDNGMVMKMVKLLVRFRLCLWTNLQKTKEPTKL